MKLLVGEGIGGTFWPPPGAPIGGVGATVTDFQGLLELLELHLGLPHGDPDWLRAVKLLGALRSVRGFWEASFVHDAWGVTRGLLSTLDALCLQGWRGESPTRRLRDLSRALELYDGGEASRLARVRERLTRRSLRWEVTLCDPVDSLPRAWRETLDALREGGAVVQEHAVPNHALPVTLHWLRPGGVIEAAAEVADFLAALPPAGTRVVLAPSVALDEALHRRGIATCGARDGHPAALEATAKALRFAHGPIAPDEVFDWLDAPDGLVPTEIARALREHLAQWPAVTGELWCAALDRCVTRGALPVALRTELDALLTPDAERPAGASRDALHRRLDRVERLLAARDPDDLHPAIRASRDLCATLRETLRSLGDIEVAAPLWQHLVHDTLREARGAARHPAEAGTASVTSPGALLAPVDVVVWWAFDSRHAEPSPRLRGLTASDLQALASAGVSLPSPDAVARAHAARHWRPVRHAREALVLVNPRRGEDGREQGTPPLLDELSAALRRVGRSALVPVTELPRPRREAVRAAAARPRARRVWSLPGVHVGPRAKESPSGLALKLACPLRWSLRYHARAQSDEEVALAPLATLAGRVGHELFASLYAHGDGSPVTAANDLRARFERDVPSRAGVWFVPGAEATRRQVAETLGAAYRSLARALDAAGATVRAAEVALSVQGGPFGPHFEGRPDLVVGDPPLIIDYKWSAGDHARALRRGTAVQLAAYAYLWRTHAEVARDRPISIGYFILRTGTLYALGGALGDGAVRVEGVAPEVTLAAMARAHARVNAELTQGTLVAAGVGDEHSAPPPEDALREGELVLAPPCRGCAYGVLCGRALEG